MLLKVYMMIIKPIKTRIFKEGEDLIGFITNYFCRLKEESIVVVTSKIIALSERRTAIVKNVRAQERLIRAESELAIPTKYVWLTIKDGMVMASAGIDESNANGKCVLLPQDSFKSARLLSVALKRKYSLKRLGVLITDSRTVPLRAGVTGVAIGYAGLRGVKDYRGTPDIFGRKFKFSSTNVADSLAAAAVLVMGEGNEQQPLALIEKAPVEFCDKINHKELCIDIKNDVYQPLFTKLSKLKKFQKKP
jgi:dihydrofolate synthase / folylpolyglutamate synthase